MSCCPQAGPTATPAPCRMSLAIQTPALHYPSPAPEQQLLISQPSASLAAAQNWDLTQFPHGFSSGEVCKGTDGRWHLIPFGCGHTELPLDRREHKHPPASPQNHHFALISWHFLMNPQCCSLQGWAAAPQNLFACSQGKEPNEGSLLSHSNPTLDTSKVLQKHKMWISLCVCSFGLVLLTICHREKQPGV